MSKSDSSIQVKIHKSMNNQMGYQNVIYYYRLGKNTPAECYLLIEKEKKKYVHLAKMLDYPNLKENYLFLNKDDRTAYVVAFDDEITVNVTRKPKRVETVFVMITDASGTTQLKNKDIPSNMTERLGHKFNSTVVNVGSDPSIFAGPNETTYLRAKIMSLLNDDNQEVPNGIPDESTEYVILNLEKKASELNITSIDFQKVGVGGLTNEFKAIVQKILLTRLIPDDLFKKIGVNHTKGIILYGPPGCGKTMIGKNIGVAIGCKNVIVINGPELSSKYVGETEKNIRAQFEKAKAKPDELFILIFDEIDAVASKRTGSEQGHNDKVVNQLLTMMDGVEPIPNLIIIGTTNRLDMLDPAVLRPGRFDLHMRIGLPDVTGRHEILQIHSNEQRKNNLFDKDVNLLEIAKLTENFSGAEMALLVNTTVSRVLDKQIDYNHIAESAKKINTILIKQNDFIEAFKEIIPAARSSQKSKEELAKRIRKEWSSTDLAYIEEKVSIIRNSFKPMIMCIDAKPKTGKTSMACQIALDLNYDNAEYVSANILMKMPDKQKIEYLSDIFEKDDTGLIILDNVESIIEFVSEHIFNKNLFHLLKNFMNETKHHVIMTTPHYHRLADMTFMDYVDKTVRLAI
jgi:SpoVK/Ycf46/Vps4 family AAA+-type ATPase